MDAKFRPFSPFPFLFIFLFGYAPLLSAKGNSSYSNNDTIPSVIYEYWMKFPADVHTTCLSDLVIPGIDYEEIGCDLLAIGHTDD